MPAGRLRRIALPQSDVARLLVQVRRRGGVTGQARIHRGQRRETGRRAVGLTDGDGPVERHDRALGEREQFVVPADDLHPIGLLGARRIGMDGGDRRLRLVLAESVPPSAVCRMTTPSAMSDVFHRERSCSARGTRLPSGRVRASRRAWCSSINARSPAVSGSSVIDANCRVSRIASAARSTSPV